jgi:protein involved in polysaccharide export with SLBB domain
MRTVIYEIPGQMTLEDVAENMIRLVKVEAGLTPNIDVQVVAEYNSIEIGALVGTTAREIVRSWHNSRHELVLREERVRPVREAILYLLGTLPNSDRLELVKQLASNPLSKEGV